MTESILDTIKTKLNIPQDDTSFDDEILVDINSAIMTLVQIGVGPSDGFVVNSNEETWSDFIGESKNYEGVKQYVYIKTLQVFDNRTMTSSVMEALTKKATELEWRLNVTAEMESAKSK